MEKEVVLITGTSSGFGFRSAIELAKYNYHVIAGMRDTSKKYNLLKAAEAEGVSDNIKVCLLDVTKDDHIIQVRNYILNTYGRLDILINNAGFCLGGLTELIEMEEWKEQFETNFFSVVKITNSFLPMMRQRRKGKIINVGSISGRFGFPGMGPYAASKFALEGYSESLRLELLPFNIHVCIIEPGSFQTEIWAKGLNAIKPTTEKDYEMLITSLIHNAKDTAKTAEHPAKVIQLIVKICKMKNPKLRYPVGKGIRTFIFLKNLLPWSLVEKLIMINVYKNKK